jgi:hypothetical protein
VGLKEAVKPYILAAEVDIPFKRLSIAALRIRLAKHFRSSIIAFHFIIYFSPSP